MKIEVLIADDHAVIRGGVRRLLEDTDDLEVAGEAANGAEALEQVRARDWGALVLDLSMPGRNGLELIKLIRSERPRLPILVFSMHQEDQYAVRAIRAGADGYLSKEGDADLLVTAIRKVAHGGVCISENVAELLVRDRIPKSDVMPHTLLSDREFEIFQKLVAGERVSDIAAELSLSVKTVSTHKFRILQKMQLAGDTDLVRYAIAHGLAPISK
jgi:DNA-binding NarL/FixJ family response regulator